MGISKNLEKFLQNEENQKLINQNSKQGWDKIYEKIPNDIIGEFTEFLVTRVKLDPAAIMGYIPNYYLYNSDIKEYKIPNSVTSIGFGAFYGCYSLTSVTIGESVTSIGQEAFYNCKSLINIIIPNNVRSIGKLAFSYCSSLTSIEIPNSITKINENTFSDCTSLAKVVIPDSVTYVDNFAFSSCKLLTHINYQGNHSQALKIFGKGRYDTEFNNRWRKDSSISKIIYNGGIIKL